MGLHQWGRGEIGSIEEGDTGIAKEYLVLSSPIINPHF
jgi:hypothetical protein